MVPLLFKSSRGLIKWKPAEIDVKQRCDAANKFRRIEAKRDTHNWISLPGNTKLSMWLIAAVSIDTEKYHIRIDWAEKKSQLLSPSQSQADWLAKTTGGRRWDDNASNQQITSRIRKTTIRLTQTKPQRLRILKNRWFFDFEKLQWHQLAEEQNSPKIHSAHPTICTFMEKFRSFHAIIVYNKHLATLRTGQATLSPKSVDTLELNANAGDWERESHASWLRSA